MSEQPTYVRMRQGAYDYIEQYSCWPKYEVLKLRADKQRPKVRNTTHLLHDLRSHLPVPAAFAELFWEYVVGTYKTNWPYKKKEDMWEQALPPHTIEEEEAAWFNWDSIKDALCGHLRMVEQMYLHNPPAEGVILPFQRIKLRQRGWDGETPHKCLNYDL